LVPSTTTAMATAGDIREILEIPQEGPPKPAPKKAKLDHGPRLTGFQREVQSLMSDSHNVPPIPIVENSRYKAKPTYAPRAFKTRKWEERRFINGARTDELELRHWKHAVPPAAGQRLLGASTNGKNVMLDGAAQGSEQPTSVNEENVDARKADHIRYDDEFPMEKYNLKASVPSYTAEEYEAHFKSEDWTKEETDYLMALCREFDMRWIVVADRYESSEIPNSLRKGAATGQKDGDTGQTNGKSSEDAMDIDQKAAPNSSTATYNAASSARNGVKPPYPQRNLEALKARYYTVASKLLSITTPPDTMTPSEFALWEKMKNFDFRTEELRKNLAEKLFMRTKEEADEERTLLEELARITKNEEEFLKMRKDLYQRLETPVLSRRADDQSTAAIYQSSSGLGALLSNLLNREKRFKRPGMIDTSRANSGQDANGDAERGTAGTATDRPRKQTWEKGQHPNQYTARRNTMDAESANGDVPKKTGSFSHTPNVRTLTPVEEAKYGVAHPQERITSGVQFRHEKASKVVLSKSAAQMAKIQAALVELGIPVRLLMPTERVSREYERLVADIVLLLDARRGVEKVGSEVKVLEESRRMRLGLPKEGEDGDRMDFDQEDKDQDAAERAQATAEGQEEADADATGEAGDDDTDADVAVEDGDSEDEDQMAKAAENKKGATNAGGEEENGDGHEGNAEADADDNKNASASEDEEDEDEEEEEEEEEEEAGEAEPDVADEDEDDDDDGDGDEEDELAGSPENQNNNDDDDDGDTSEVENGEEEDDDHKGTADHDDDDDDDDEEDPVADNAAEAEHAPQPAAVPARLHKRSASVISDGSRAGSNRSGVSRKKGRR
jgi:DNA methyltransferase 1-associated protein 1